MWSRTNSISSWHNTTQEREWNFGWLPRFVVVPLFLGGDSCSSSSFIVEWHPFRNLVQTNGNNEPRDMYMFEEIYIPIYYYMFRCVCDPHTHTPKITRTKFHHTTPAAIFRPRFTTTGWKLDMIQKQLGSIIRCMSTTKVDRCRAYCMHASRLLFRVYERGWLIMMTSNSMQINSNSIQS